MPASEVMELYHEGKLHSGRSGRIVRNPSQARAIQLSYLRKEGHHIPRKKSRMAEAFRKARR
jgi:hypothetical protein